MAVWRYEVPLPLGPSPAVFIPLYAGEIQKKLSTLLPAAAGYRTSVQRISDDKYEVVALRGALSGMKVEVRMKVTLNSGSAPALVSVHAASKTEQVLTKIVGILMGLLAIPAFLVFLLRGRLLLAIIATFIVLLPVMIAGGVVITAVMSLLYATVGNEFDSDRRAKITELLKQTPVPDPLAALRGVVKEPTTAPPPPPPPVAGRV